MPPAPSFLCDEMLAGLAQWLRAAGYDTLRAERGEADRVLLARALAEDRLLLTRDRAILQHRTAGSQVVVLSGGALEAWAHEMRAEWGLDWLHAPFTRCLVCNTPLVPAPPHAGALVPEQSRRLGPLRWCPTCAKPYWPGGHVRRMLARLRRWAGGG